MFARCAALLPSLMPINALLRISEAKRHQARGNLGWPPEPSGEYYTQPQPPTLYTECRFCSVQNLENTLNFRHKSIFAEV